MSCPLGAARVPQVGTGGSSSFTELSSRRLALRFAAKTRSSPVILDRPLKLVFGCPCAVTAVSGGPDLKRRRERMFA